MNCKKIREELVFLYADQEMEAELRIAFDRHVADCPHCAQSTQYTTRLLMIVRERAGRCSAPNRLRERILATLPHRRSFQC